MNIITLSRQFGSGGRELGKRLADALGYDYYDREIIAAVAEKSELSPDFVEDAMQSGWQSGTMTFRHTLGAAVYAQSAQVSLLLRQKEVIESIAAAGRDFIIVGRSADVILREHNPLNIFVCATQEAKLKRCLDHAPEGESLTEKELLRQMKRIDKVRAQTRALICGADWGRPEQYHLTINTTDFDIKQLVPAVAEFAVCRFGSMK